MGRFASEDVWAAWRGGKVSAEKAAAIADLGRDNEGLQAQGVKQALKGDSADQIRHTLAILKRYLPAKKQKQGDLFGFDESAIVEAEKLGKAVSSIVRELKQRLARSKRFGVRRAIGLRWGLNGCVLPCQQSTSAFAARQSRPSYGLPPTRWIL